MGAGVCRRCYKGGSGVFRLLLASVVGVRY
jgi:hypothetical protein